MSGFKAFRVYKENGKVVGRLATLELNDLTPGEVVIRAAYSSVNYKDALGATGTGKILTRFPLVPGIDVAGRVEASEDPRFKADDAVLVTGYDLGVARDGGYSEMVRVPGDWVVPLPPGLSLFEAMALGTAGFTVALCIKRMEDNGQAPGNGPIVVTGATGGVGSLAVDILSKLGYEVAAVSGKPDEFDRLKALGAVIVLDRHTLDLGARPLEKARWAGAIDNVGGDILTWITRTTSPWGNICAVGLAGSSQLETTVMPFILRGVSLLGITSSGCPAPLRHTLWQRLANDLRPAHLDTIVTRVATLSDLPDVFTTMLKGAMKGRTVVRIGPG
jgi:NADPH2:quinone reductase